MSLVLPSRKALLLGGSLPFPGAILGLDFVRQIYQFNGSVFGSLANVPGFTGTRVSQETQTWADGHLSYCAANVPCVSDLGFNSTWPSATNVVIYARDLTNTYWTKTNITPALNQIGVDLAANSASSITATAGNATILQTISVSSSARFQTAYVKRITGSGVINMTMDGGTTWTAITLTPAWTRVSIPTQTLASLSVGFQIVTNGDAIAVDFVQNEAGTSATPAIPTTSSAATRATDSWKITTNMNPATFSLLVKAYLPGGPDNVERELADWGINAPNFVGLSRGANSNNNGNLYSRWNSSGQNNQDSSASFSSPIALNGAMSYDGSVYRSAWNGVSSTASASGKIGGLLTTLVLGNYFNGGSPLEGSILKIVGYASALSDTQLQEATK